MCTGTLCTKQLSACESAIGQNLHCCVRSYDLWGARSDQAWVSLCPASAHPGAVGQAGAPFQAAIFLSRGGPILASAQETCLCSHSMQACSKATSLSWPNIIQSRPGGSRAVSVMGISTWPCSPRAHACPRSLLLAHAIQQWLISCSCQVLLMC